MVISKYNSSKILILNTILIIMVLFIHSYFLEGEKYRVAMAIQRFFSGYAFCGTANRLFFLLSGMLFFNSITQIKDCFLKMKKRIKTILIPYLIWNCIFVGWYILLKIIPGADAFVNGNVFSNFDTLWHGIKYLWIEPASFPLWFLRDLICLFLLSPVIFLFLKYLRGWGVLVYFILGFFVPTFGFWFILGGLIAICYDLDRIDNMLPLPVVIVSSLIFLVGCFCFSIHPNHFRLPQVLDSIIAFSGLIMMWRFYDYMAKGRILNKSSFWSSLIGYSFFVYLFHEPVFNIIKNCL